MSNEIPLELDDTPISVTFPVDGENITIEGVPRYLHEAIKYQGEWRKISRWKIYVMAVKKYGRTPEAIQRYVNEGFPCLY
ncbi:hypothetical protein HY839_00190 [Candidatus Azambacteria bacterium]|nr:hypothetical protein [Candidatus Azambacteria bacterium]